MQGHGIGSIMLKNTIPWSNAPTLFGTAKAGEVLYVIGNGFDLFNEMPTSYWDFREYIKKNHKYNLMSIEQVLEYDSLWNDFEAALGDADIDHIYNEANILNEIDYDHPGRSAAVLQDTPVYELENTLDNLEAYFHEWVNQIEIPARGMVPQLFHRPGIAINFNYTLTLEKAYNLDPKLVYHIHGKQGKGKLIYGHCNHYDEDYYDEALMQYEIDSKEELASMLNKVEKPVEHIIKCNQALWQDIANRNIKEVVVLGHSMADVDLPYFKKIASIVGTDAIWHISWYDGKRDANGLTDKDKKQKAVNELGLKNVNWFQLEDFE